MIQRLLILLLLLAPVVGMAQIAPKPDGRQTRTNASSTGSAQDVSELSFRDRLVPGGGLQLQFGNVTVVELSPTMGYRLTNRWVAGAGFNYLYYRQSYAGVASSFNVFGTRAFTYYQLFKNVIAYSEFERLSLPTYNTITGNPERYWVSNLWVGAGYRQWLGSRTALDFLFLYNTLYNPNTSLYNSPFTYRMTLSFRL